MTDNDEILSKMNQKLKKQESIFYKKVRTRRSNLLFTLHSLFLRVHIKKPFNTANENIVAIIIIVHKPTVSKYEAISLSQCVKVFHKRPIFLVCPEGMDVSEYKNISKSIHFDFIKPSWQKDYRSFNRLKILPFLYKRYQGYRYLLFYELDAFVFKDELDFWIGKGYDYIGAPWKEGWTDADDHSDFIGVGNGGFSLRRVSSHLRVLTSFSYIIPLKLLVRRWLDMKLHMKIFTIPSIAADLTFRNNTLFLFNDYRGNEDVFWGKIANNNFKWFNVAPVDQAIKFSFETTPYNLFLANNKMLPFGCHGWWKYDLDFWTPFILNEGYIL